MKTAKPGTAMHTAYCDHMLKDPGFSLNPDFDVDKALATIKTSDKAVLFGMITMLDNPDFIILDRMEDRLIGYLAVGLQKNSEFKEVFDFHLLNIMQTAVMDKEIRKYMEGNRPDASVQRGVSEAEALGPESLMFLQLLMIWGIVTAILVGVLEKAISSIR